MPGMFEIELQFVPGGNDPSQFEALLDAVADELAERGVDADYTARLADLAVTWTIDVPDASEESLIGALSALRRALDATGRISTGKWAARHDVVSTRHMVLA
ncbi:hypothetical protein BST25_05995 [Mycobacterium heidelbergense]|uniref:Uncharacterized protein n=2 Tax=Mycobacterium heidelbergense TaxID=53376 RepID=A0A1X0DSV3_MYCHE|nr:hypothetical protein BST25_05995 [Mycobacterium heidelbergense]BBZ50295.1 hypothetical protein MHEI_20120 [Mycobacterium heidelbergense]